MTAPTSSHRWLFWVVGLLGLTADLGSKYGIFGYLYNEGRGGTSPMIGQLFFLDVKYYSDKKYDGTGIGFQLRTISGKHVPFVNHGALFGMGGQDDQGRDHNHWFAIVSIAAAIFVAGWSLRADARRDRFLMVVLGLIFAGTLGNLYDRVVFRGVRDFLHFHWEGVIDWPVFNIADVCLVTGASLLALEAFFRPQASSEPTPVAATSPQA
ncbi:MAG: signal peptidase II [Gemmataceae bacterium]|nr:signal peptidase II [Gemmataceae bacterium]